MTKPTIRSTFISTIALLALAGCSAGPDGSPTDISEPGSSSQPLTAPPVASVATAEGTHHGGPGGMDPSAFLKRLDKNGDGKLEVSELPPRMQARLGKADTNADGVLSTEELAAHRATMWKEHHDPASVVKRLDKNGDGKLQVAELPPRLRDFLGKADTDKDGVITVAEIQAQRTTAEKDRFAKKDKNGDGALTADEVSPRRWEHLKVADADGNGGVTLAEMDQAIAAGTLRMRGRGFRRGHMDGPPDSAPVVPQKS